MVNSNTDGTATKIYLKNKSRRCKSNILLQNHLLSSLSGQFSKSQSKSHNFNYFLQWGLINGSGITPSKAKNNMQPKQGLYYRGSKPSVTHLTSGRTILRTYLN